MILTRKCRFDDLFPTREIPVALNLAAHWKLLPEQNIRTVFCLVWFDRSSSCDHPAAVNDLHKCPSATWRQDSAYPCSGLDQLDYDDP